MDLSIIIVTHNSSGLIGKCLSSIRENPPSREYEVIIIDNASSDGTPESIRAEFPEMRLVVNSDNRGYSRGVNQGISLSSGSLVLILNPDIIAREDSIDRLMDFMDDNPDAGMAGSKLVDPDGGYQYSCRSFYTVRALFLRRTVLGKIFPRAKALREHLLMDYDHEQTREVDWILGACMMVRRKAIDKIGLMDERFFLYFEDVDWCYRMKQHGWKVFYVPGSMMIHAYRRASAGSIFNKPFLIHLLSLFRYYEKWNRVFYFFKRHRQASKSVVFILSDLLAINCGFFGAYWLRYLTDGYFTNELYPLGWYKYFIIFFNLIFLLSFLFGRMYRVRRETGSAEELGRIIRVVLAGLAILMASTYLSRIRIYSRAVIIGQGVLGIILVFIFRRFVRRVHRVFVKAGFDHKRVAFAGGGKESRDLDASLAEYPELGMEIVGRIGEGEDSLGTAAEAEELIERFKIQEIFVLPTFQDDNKMMELMSASRKKSVPLKIVTQVARFLDRDVRVDEIGGYFMLSLERGPVSRLRIWMIRFVEICISAVVLPFSLLAALLLRFFALLTGRAKFFTERRRGSAKIDFEWPRVVFRSGREASDIFKPRLYLSIIAGRIGYVGFPPLITDPGKEEARHIGRVIVGVTGRWRLQERGAPDYIMYEGLVEQERNSMINFVILLLRSLPNSLKGSYPDWFYNEEVK